MLGLKQADPDTDVVVPPNVDVMLTGAAGPIGTFNVLVTGVPLPQFPTICAVTTKTLPLVTPVKLGVYCMVAPFTLFGFTGIQLAGVSVPLEALTCTFQL